MQFEAQRRGYAADFPGSEDYILLFGDEPAGRLLCAETESEVRIVDIAVQTPWRNRGLGTWALRVAADRARARSKLLRLSVRRDNEAALRLYRRFGFVLIAEDALYIGMECDPARAAER